MIGRLLDNEPSSSYLHFSSLLPQIIFPFILSFFRLPLLCWIGFDRKYSLRCCAVVDLGPWQTPSIGLICIHKSIGYLTLANILGCRDRRCWAGRVTLSLVMEIWWSVTALLCCWLHNKKYASPSAAAGWNSSSWNSKVEFHTKNLRNPEQPRVFSKTSLLGFFRIRYMILGFSGLYSIFFVALDPGADRGLRGGGGGGLSAPLAKSFAPHLSP